MRKTILAPALGAFLALLVLRIGGQEGGTVAAAPADDSPYRVTSSIDWSRRSMVVGIALNLAKAGLALPGGRLVAERMVSQDLPGLAKSAFFSIPVDSEGSIGDRIVSGDLDIGAIMALTDKLRKVDDSMSKDLLWYQATWELPLDAAASLFVTWKASRALPAPVGWTATRVYTGIVIYVDGPLPVHGERGVVDSLQRGLFPRIFADDMSVVMDRWYVDPEVLDKEGPFGYVTKRSADDEARVGDEPLLLRAVGLFGKNRTDLIISKEDAIKILGNAANRDLVRQGRIIVVQTTH